MITSALADSRISTVKNKHNPHIQAASCAQREAIEEVLTPGAVSFLASLHRRFKTERAGLLNHREEMKEWIKSGGRPDFSAASAHIRSGDWRVAEAPVDLRCRHVEITGPCEPKTMINALNSGADVFMADIEDALAPSWENVISAQACLRAYSRGTLVHRAGSGKIYNLQGKHATLLVRPRGWHLKEANFTVDGEVMSASLFDFGLHFFHNARKLIERGSGPYFYLAKLEGALEARLWNEVFLFAQEQLGIPSGTIRATVLIETFQAAFAMEEILYELKEHASGLNAGRWDYLFSYLKNFPFRGEPLPDRALLTMDLPFLKAYSGLLVRSCHKRGAHAIGGMAAFVPSRRDESVNSRAFAKISEDKEREANQGFDGSWVAHPDLVAPVKRIFAAKLLGAADQKSVMANEAPKALELFPSKLPAVFTEAGARKNISVTLEYLDHWVNGQGAVAIDHLMEDVATAEVSRAQLWQWLHRRITFHEGPIFTEELFRQLLIEEWAKLRGSNRVEISAEVLQLVRQLVLHHEPVGFLTQSAYSLLLAQSKPMTLEGGV